MRHNTLLATTAIVAGALYFGSPITQAKAGIITDSFCGPSSGQGCEGPEADHMVFLQAKTNTMHGLGNIGSQSGLPLMHIDSTGGMLDMFLDLKNGFATIKPDNGISFNGLDISIPGFGFTKLIFDVQLTPQNKKTDDFTIDGKTAGVDDGSFLETDKPDADTEFSITAIGGVFTDAFITSLTGFDEIKHIEVAGVCTLLSNGSCTPVIIVDAPEPATALILGTSALGLMLAKKKGRKVCKREMTATAA